MNALFVTFLISSTAILSVIRRVLRDLRCIGRRQPLSTVACAGSLGTPSKPRQRRLSAPSQVFPLESYQAAEKSFVDASPEVLSQELDRPSGTRILFPTFPSAEALG